MARTSEIRTPENVYLIEKESDFPVQDDTTITLSSWVYTLNAVIITGKNFVIWDGEVVQMRWTDAFIWGIAYVGTGDMWTFSDIVSLSFTETFMTTPLWTLYNVTNVSMTLAQIFVINTAIFDCVHFWSIENVAQFTGYFNAFTDIWSWILLDSVDIVSFSQSRFDGWKNTTTTMFDFDWDISSIVFWLSEFGTGSNESVFDFNASLVVEWVAISGCTYVQNLGGSLFATWSRDQTDIRITFDANVNMKKSGSDVELELKNNLVVTTFAGQNIPIRVAGVWVDSAENFITDSNGRATYLWLAQDDLHVIANPNSVLDVGTNKDVTFYISKWNDTLNTITVVSDQWGWVIRFTTWNPHWLTTGERVTMTNTTSYNTTYTITVIDTTNFDVTETFVATETGNWQVIIERSSAHGEILSATKGNQITVITGVLFNTNDFIELFTENNSDWTWLLIQDSNLLIN